MDKTVYKKRGEQKRLKNKGIFASAHFYAILANLLWPLAYVLTRNCSKYLAPFQTASIRMMIAAVTMALILIIKKTPFPKPKDLLWFAFSGFVGFFLYMLLFNIGAPMVTSATGNVILAISPVVTAVGARLLFKEKLVPIQWISIGIAFVGVILVTVLSGGFTVNIGLAWLIGGMLLFSTYNLIQRYLSRRHETFTITAWSLIFGGIYFSPFLPSGLRALPGAPADVYISLLILGSCCSGLAYGVWTKAFGLAKKASSVSNYTLTNPFVSAIYGYLLIGDPVEISALIGGAVIMTGLVLFNFGPRIWGQTPCRTLKR